MLGSQNYKSDFKSNLKQIKTENDKTPLLLTNRSCKQKSKEKQQLVKIDSED